MDDRQYMGKLHREAKAANTGVIHVVWQPGYDDDRGELIAASRDPRIAEAIEKLGHEWFTEEVELVADLDEIVNVPVYTSVGVRTQIGLWNLEHRETPTWKRRVKCGEADLELGPKPTPGVHRAELVRVTGTNAELVRATFIAEALKIEAEYGHDKLRTQVEELDPMERF